MNANETTMTTAYPIVDCYADVRDIATKLLAWLDRHPELARAKGDMARDSGTDGGTPADFVDMLMAVARIFDCIARRAERPDGALYVELTGRTGAGAPTAAEAAAYFKGEGYAPGFECLARSLDDVRDHAHALYDHAEMGFGELGILGHETEEQGKATEAFAACALEIHRLSGYIESWHDWLESHGVLALKEKEHWSRVEASKRADAAAARVSP